MVLDALVAMAEPSKAPERTVPVVLTRMRPVEPERPPRKRLERRNGGDR